MQRLEPRELVAAGVCAALPLGYWFGAVLGGPDVLDGAAGGGAVVATAVVREWLAGSAAIGTAGSFADGPYVPAVPLLSLLAAVLPLGLVSATRFVVAVALWTCGYAGWRVTRTVAPGSGWVGGCSVALAAQIAAGRATLEADLPAFTAGFVLLTFAHPGFALLAGGMGLPAASAVVAIGAIRRRPLLLLAAVGLAAVLVAASDLPGAALRNVQPVASVPAYGTTSGAWFPMPPAEAVMWTRVEGRAGQWLSPRSAMLVGDAPPAPFIGDGGRPPAPVEPSVHAQSWKVWVRGGAEHLESRLEGWMPIFGAERRAIGRGIMISPLGAVLLFLALRACERRKLGRFVPVVAGGLACAGGGLLWLREIRHDEGVSGRELSELVEVLSAERGGMVLMVPPPSAPYFAGRLRADRWTGVLAASGHSDAAASLAGPAVALVGELARKAEYGLDVQAAERLWGSPAGPAPVSQAAAAGVRYIVLDRGALPAPAFRLVSGWIERRANVPVAIAGELVVFDLVAGVAAVGEEPISADPVGMPPP